MSCRIGQNAAVEYHAVLAAVQRRIGLPAADFRLQCRNHPGRNVRGIRDDEIELLLPDRFPQITLPQRSTIRESQLLRILPGSLQRLFGKVRPKPRRLFQLMKQREQNAARSRA